MDTQNTKMQIRRDFDYETSILIGKVENVVLNNLVSTSLRTYYELMLSILESFRVFYNGGCKEVWDKQKTGLKVNIGNIDVFFESKEMEKNVQSIISMKKLASAILNHDHYLPCAYLRDEIDDLINLLANAVKKDTHTNNNRKKRRRNVENKKKKKANNTNNNNNNNNNSNDNMPKNNFYPQYSGTFKKATNFILNQFGAVKPCRVMQNIIMNLSDVLKCYRSYFTGECTLLFWQSAANLYSTRNMRELYKSIVNKRDIAFVELVEKLKCEIIEQYDCQFPCPAVQNEISNLIRALDDFRSRWNPGNNHFVPEKAKKSSSNSNIKTDNQNGSTDETNFISILQQVKHAANNHSKCPRPDVLFEVKETISCLQLYLSKQCKINTDNCDNYLRNFPVTVKSPDHECLGTPKIISPFINVQKQEKQKIPGVETQKRPEVSMHIERGTNRAIPKKKKLVQPNSPAFLKQQKAKSKNLEPQNEQQATNLLFGTKNLQQTTAAVFETQNQQQTTTPLVFGTQKPQQTRASIFGTQNLQHTTAPIFGTQNLQQTTTPSIFGTQKQKQNTTSLFGTNNQQPSTPSVCGIQNHQINTKTVGPETQQKQHSKKAGLKKQKSTRKTTTKTSSSLQTKSLQQEKEEEQGEFWKYIKMTSLPGEFEELKTCSTLDSLIGVKEYFSKKLIKTNLALNDSINNFLFDELFMTKQHIKSLEDQLGKVSLTSKEQDLAQNYLLFKNMLTLVEGILDSDTASAIDHLIIEYANIIGKESTKKSIDEENVEKTIECGNSIYLKRCKDNLLEAKTMTSGYKKLSQSVFEFDDQSKSLCDLIEKSFKLEQELDQGKIIDEPKKKDFCVNEDDDALSSEDDVDNVNNFTITKEGNVLSVEFENGDLNEKASPFLVMISKQLDNKLLEKINKELVQYDAFMIMSEDEERDVKYKIEFTNVHKFLAFVQDEYNIVEDLNLIQRKANVTQESIVLNRNLSMQCLTFIQSWTCISEQVNYLISIFQESQDHIESKITRDVKNALKYIYPNHMIHTFGSRATGLALPDSDCDLYVDISGREYFNGMDHSNQKRCVSKLRSQFYKSCHFSEVLGLTRTFVPIIKVHHTHTGISCDISFKDGASVENTRLLRYYLQIDTRVRWLVTAVKLWAQYNNVNGRTYFTSHALAWLVLFYLMQEKIVPPVIKLRTKSISKFINTWDVSFEPLHSWKPDKTYSEVELFNRFFAFVLNLDLKSICLCTFTGEVIEKKSVLDLKWMKKYKNGVFRSYIEQIQMENAPRGDRYRASSYEMIELNENSGLCIQDPFEFSKNVAQCVKNPKADHFISLCKETHSILESLG